MGDDTNHEPSAVGDGGAGHPGPRWRLIAAVAVVVVLAAVLGVVLANRDGDEGTATQRSTTSTEPTASTTSQPGATAPGPASSSAGQPSAADALEPFFSAATTMDGQLRAAATAINGSGPPWEGVTEEAANSVRAAELERVADAIPAGPPTELLRSVILVYSDLSSRRAAMQSFAHAGEFPYTPIDPLGELANGRDAAGRFDGDLAAARSLAAAAPPITRAPSDARATAETMLLVKYVDEANAGCDGRGGAVVTQLPRIDWRSDNGGTIGGPSHPITFHAALGPDGRWTVRLDAC